MPPDGFEKKGRSPTVKKIFPDNSDLKFELRIIKNIEQGIKNN